MGQLKPSEVRLLLLFAVTVIGLASFLTYELYAKKLVGVSMQKTQLEADRQHLLTLKTQQTEYNEKLVWMNANQPLARDELEAKEALDRAVSLRGIEAAGLVLVSSPPEKAPSKEEFYWAFERRLVVEGTLQNIVQWLTTLQSESSFRAVTQLHIFPKKKQEPESLTCEITLEQRYATDEAIQMTTPGVAMASVSTEMPVVASSISTGGETSESSSDADEAEESKAADQPPVSRRVVTPGSGSNQEAPKPIRPKIRLPQPQVPNQVEDGDASAAAETPAANGMLSNARRNTRQAAVLPPVLQEDLDAAQQFAYDNDTAVEPVHTAVVAPEPEEDVEPEPVFRVEEDQLPIAPDEEPEMTEGPEMVGESWTEEDMVDPENPPDDQPKPTEPEDPQTY